MRHISTTLKLGGSVLLTTGAFIALVGVTACVDECRNAPGSAEYRRLSNMYSAGNTLPRQFFSEYPVETQIDIYLYSRNCTGDTRIEPLLIRNGKQKISQIIQRVREDKRSRNKAFLVGVLISINTDCQCINKDSAIVDELEQVGKELSERKTTSADDAYIQIYLDNVETLKEQVGRREESR